MYQQYIRKRIIRLSEICSSSRKMCTHKRTQILGSIQIYCCAWCCLQGSFVQRVADGMLETAVYTLAESYWISAGLTTFLTVCASVEFFQDFLFRSKRHFPALYYS